MPRYEIAFLVAIILFGTLALMQERMRQQVHHNRFGDHKISPWSLHFSNNLLGLFGIWNLHKCAFKHSRLRSSFVVVFIMLLVSLVVGFCGLLYYRP